MSNNFKNPTPIIEISRLNVSNFARPILDKKHVASQVLTFRGHKHETFCLIADEFSV